MRSGFSDALQQRVQRFPPAAGHRLEIVAISAEVVKKIHDEFSQADSLTGLTVFADGGVQLNETSTTAIDQSTIVGGQYLTDLDRSSPFFVAEILWGGATSPQVELLSLTLRLAPNVSGGTQEVQQWVLQLFNRTGEEAEGRFTDPVIQMVPICQPFYKTATTSEGDVVFSWAGAAIKPRPRSITVPTGLRSGVTATTYVMVWGITGDGTIAGNTGWTVDTAHSTYSSGGSTLSTAQLSQVASSSIAKPGSSWFRHADVANKLPRLKAIWNTASAATITFTTSPAVLGDEIENSDVETDILGYEQVNGAPSTVVRDNAQAHSGTWAVKVTTTNVDYSGVRAIRLLGPTFPYELFPAVAGESYTLEWWVFATGAAIGKTMVVGISWRDLIDTVLHNDECTPVTLGAGWQKLTVTATAVATTVYAALYLSQRPAQGVWDFWADDVHFAPVPTDTVEFTGSGETPAGSTLAYAVQADDATWLPFLDGQTTDDLSAANPSHTISKRIYYAVRCTLTPSAAGDATPTLRTLGVRSLTSYDCSPIAMLSGGQAQVDPATLKPSIADPTLIAIKDGVADFRDLMSQVLSSYHIGELSVRVFWGAADLNRGFWMPYDTYFVDDVRDAAGGVEVSLLSRLVLLRGVLPPFDPNSGLRKAITTLQNVSIADAWAELIDGQLGLPGSYRGDGPTDTKNVSKVIPSNVQSPYARAGSLVAQLLDQQGWQTVQAKDQVDGLSFLAGGATIASQGKIKWVPISVGDVVTLPDTTLGFAITQIDAPRVIFHEGEIEWVQVTPGFSERVPEYYVPYNWNVAVQKFGFEYRAFNNPGLVHLGVGRVASQPTVLDTDTAQWIPSDGGTAPLPSSSLAQRVATRQATLLGTGMMLWRFRSTYPHAELELGDVVVVPTDRFVALNPLSETSVVGRYTASAVIVETEPGGREFGVWVRQWSDLAPTLQDVGYDDPPTTKSGDLVLNGDFERDFTHWCATVGPGLLKLNSVAPFRGIYSLQVTMGPFQTIKVLQTDNVSSGVPGAPIYIPVIPGDVFRVHGAAIDRASDYVGFREYDAVRVAGADTAVLNFNGGTAVYLEKDGTYTVPAGVYFLTVLLKCTNAGGATIGTEFDEIHVFHRP